MAKSRKVTPKIEILKKGKVLNSFLLNRTRLVIGSAPGAHVRLKAEHISPEHLVIELVNRRYLEAVNITGDPHMRHQGESFERVRLAKGSTVTLGKLAFRLTFVEQEVVDGSLDGISRDEDSIAEEPRTTAAPDPPPVRPAKPVAEPAPVLPGPGEDLVDLSSKPAEMAEQTTPSMSLAAPPVASEIEAEAVKPEPAGAELLVFLLIYPPGNVKRKRVRLPTGNYTIGRRDCDINLHYAGIADQHATLMVMPDGNIYVQGQAKDPPILLEGEAVDLAPFKQGQTLSIGSLRFALDVIRVDTVVGSTPETSEAEKGTAGAWVEAALRSDRGGASPVTDPRMGAEQPSPLPVRRISAAQSQPRMRITDTDPKISAKQWIRQAVDDADTHPAEDPARASGPAAAAASRMPPAGTAAPDAPTARAATVPPPATPPPDPVPAVAPPRARPTPMQPPAPEKRAPVAAQQAGSSAQFSQWATTTIPPEYRARKRRRALLTFIAVLAVVGCGSAAVVGWNKSREGNSGGGRIIPDGERGREEAADLEDADGSYAGLETEGRRRSGGWSEGVVGHGSDARTASRSKSRSAGGSGSSTGDRSGPTYGPGGSYSGSVEAGAGLAGAHNYGGVDPSLDPDIIAIGNPGPNARVIDFGSPNLGGTVVEDAEAEYIQRVAELEFEMAEESSPGTRGWVDMRDVEAVLHSIAPAARMCYGRSRENDPSLEGTMVLILTLSTGGQISTVSLDVTSSSLVDTDLKRCVERQIKSKNYPVPKGGPVTFSYPFRFNP